MYIFRGARNQIAGKHLFARVWHGWQLAASPEVRLRRLLAAGDLECAIADCVCAANDYEPPILRCARDLLLAAACNFVAGGEVTQPRAADSARLRIWMRPRSFSLAAAEGFRFYALHPSAYVAAAQRWIGEHGGEKRAWVLGLRTIGSPLGAVVAAALARAGYAVRFASLRPRGLPEDRYYRWTGELAEALASWPGEFLLVDEGPGLSGSSFASLVTALRQLNIPVSRVALLPSWDPPSDRLTHPQAREQWSGWRRYVAEPPHPPAGALRDLGAGRWRELFAPGRPIPVWPLHDRMKFLDASGRKIFRFAGLCDPARDAAKRSRRLSRAGFSPEASEAGDGWISLPVLPAQLLFFASPSRRILEQWADWAGAYIAWCATEFRLAGRALPSNELLEMLPTNCRLLLGRLPPLPEPEPGPCCRLDGRMLPEEWGCLHGQFVKFDALDHGDDHFFPGPADPAWDLAGIEIELGDALGSAVLQSYCRRSGDLRIAARLRWYRPAYAAFRAAFCAFAARQTAAPDAGWFELRHRHYQRRLEACLNPAKCLPDEAARSLALA